MAGHEITILEIRAQANSFAEREIWLCFRASLQVAGVLTSQILTKAGWIPAENSSITDAYACNHR
ncbi:hypothetical protein BJX65DRAFT_134798 [Aspergillus insuetus]